MGWMDYKGKKVLITGASSGLGLALALFLQEKGADLVLTYCSEKHLSSALDSLGGSGSSRFLRLDQGDPESIGSFLSEVSTFDFAFLNAGTYFPSGPAESFPDSTFCINAIGTYRLLKGLLEKGTVCFTLITSMNRAWPAQGFGALFGKTISLRRSYAYSKEALSAFPSIFPGARVKVVEPGLMKTNIYGKRAPKFWKMANKLALIFGWKPSEAAAEIASAPSLDGIHFAPKGPFRLRGQLIPLPYDWDQKEKEGKSFLDLLERTGLT